MASPATFILEDVLANRPAAHEDNTGWLFFQTDSGGDGEGLYRSDGTDWTKRATLGSGDAADVAFDPTGLANTSATDVQAALEDYDAAITAAAGGGGGSDLIAPPALSSWAWINQGGATASDSSAIYVGASKYTGIVLTAPAGGSDNVRFLKMAAASAPYTIIMACQPSIIASNYFSTGFVWRESGSGKLIIVGPKYDGGFKLGNYKFNSPTSPNSSYGDIAVNWTGLAWLKLVDDNTDRKTYYSNDGVNWLLMHSVGRTDFLTANEVGFGIHVNNGTYTAAMSLVHWDD